MSTIQEPDIPVGTPVLTIDGDLVGAVRALDDDGCVVGVLSGGDVRLDVDEVRRIGTRALCTSLDGDGIADRLRPGSKGTGESEQDSDAQTDSRVEERSHQNQPKDDQTRDSARRRYHVPAAVGASAALVVTAALAYRRGRERGVRATISRALDRAHSAGLFARG
jgi:hypothetical protein